MKRYVKEFAEDEIRHCGWIETKYKDLYITHIRDIVSKAERGLITSRDALSGIYNAYGDVLNNYYHPFGYGK